MTTQSSNLYSRYLITSEWFFFRLPLRSTYFETNSVPDNKCHPGVARKHVVVPLRVFFSPELVMY